MPDAIPADAAAVSQPTPPRTLPRNPRRQSDERRGRLPRIVFQVAEPNHRVVVEIEAPRLDQVDQRLRPKLVGLHAGKQRRRDRIGACLPVPLAIDDIAPPLQADFAGQRLARHVANARHLDIERIERVQRATAFRRREQRGDEAVQVGCTDKLGAIGERILHGGSLAGLELDPEKACPAPDPGWPAVFGTDYAQTKNHTAIRPAPTRRLSISITL